MTAAVIGGGPGGLMAAEILSAAGLKVTVYERMPSVGRKLLMAGRGGLNLTHSEPFERFVRRYGAAAPWLAPILADFPPAALIDWAEGLGQPTFVGSSGRIFPKAMKASPLLRAWLVRLAAQGVVIRGRHDWLGWDGAGNLAFAGQAPVPQPDVTILALGGASWPRLGSTGAWVPVLQARGVAVTPLRPANCGFTVAWSPHFRGRFEGTPLKNLALSFAGQTARGDLVVTGYGIEGGALYALSAALRDAGGDATLVIDLRPDLTAAQLRTRLDRLPAGQSLANLLRKGANLPPVAINLLREACGQVPADLAGAIKAVPLRLSGPQPIDRAISTAGGIARVALDDGLMLRALPGVHAVGEMLDWEAPTGGYLLQATFATAVRAARAALRRLAGGDGRPASERSPF